jgi:Leucine-rich repeat (LRR) protein
LECGGLPPLWLTADRMSAVTKRWQATALQRSPASRANHFNNRLPQKPTGGVCTMDSRQSTAKEWRFDQMMKTLFLLATVLLLWTPTTYASQVSRDKLIAEIQRLGGSLEFDETQKDKPIVKIDLHGTKVTDRDLVILQDLKELRTLDLRLTHIGDAGVANLKNLKKLQTLNLFRSELTDKGLAYLRNLKRLQTLLIGGTKVTDAGLANLRNMQELKKLSLFQTQVSDAGVPHLKRLSKLETLLISGSLITEAGTRELQVALPRLRFSETT